MIFSCFYTITDGTREGIDCRINRFQRFNEWILYCINATYRWKSADACAARVQSHEETLQNTGIDVVGNHLDNLFILPEKIA
jgi:hypothetical protein